jgi:hypothetical protein
MVCHKFHAGNQLHGNRSVQKRPRPAKLSHKAAPGPVGMAVGTTGFFVTTGEMRRIGTARPIL